MLQMNLKIDPSLKHQVDEISEKIGLTATDVIRVMLKKFVLHRGFPFLITDVRDPYNPEYNVETLQAMRDVKAGKNIGKTSLAELDAAWETGCEKSV
jgi:addiction module RelB/DinJ family antitoxin